MKKIAWIGAGVMGAPMAGHLVKNGYTVSAFSRHAGRLGEKAGEYGFAPAASIGQAVADADAVFVMVGYPSDVESVFLGEGGILQNARPGALLVDMTTSSPALAERLAAEGKSRGFKVLDAPVSGGDSGAKNATLSIMVGGEPADFALALPLLQCLGKSIHHMGPAGSGQHTKACNQICVAGATAAYTEALVYARRVGLSPEAMLSAISGGAAGSWQISNMAPRVLKGDLEPGFFVKHFVKDMRIIQQEAGQAGIELPMLETVLSLYEKMVEEGRGDRGTQALIEHYEA